MTKDYKKVGLIALTHTVIFVTAFILNILWEHLHSSLYLTHIKIKSMIMAYLSMGFVDALLVLFIYWVITIQTRDFYWIAKLKKQWLLVTTLGLLISYAVEVRNVYLLKTWSYKEIMPIIPYLNVGLTPILQMSILPLITFFVTANIISKRVKR